MIDYALSDYYIMTNVMPKFLIYLSVYFCLTHIGLSFSPSSEAGVQLRQWFKSPVYDVGADTIHRRLEPLPKSYTCR
jgi:E3 ubiquitin-protein ligase DOA10